MILFSSVFELARFLDKIEFKCLEIHVESNMFFLSSYPYNKKEEKNEKKRIISKLKPFFKKANQMICHFNKIKNKEFAFLRSEDIITMDFKEFKKIINEKEFTKSGQKHAWFRRDVFFKAIENSIVDFIKSFENMLDTFGGANKKWKMRKKTFSKFAEIMSIYSFGFFESTVILCSKHLEESITEYFRLLKRIKKIQYKIKEIDGWDLDTKINILRKERLITENQKAKLLSIKWDRNSYAHPSRKSEALILKEDADAIIKISINLLQYFELKIIGVYKKLGIKV